MSDAARARVLRARSGRRHRHGQARGGQKFTATSIVNYLVNDVAAAYEDRPGGYTRVIRLGKSRNGDNASMAVLQLVGTEDSSGSVTRPERTTRQRRTERRYAAAARAIKKDARGAEGEPAEDEGIADVSPPQATTEEDQASSPEQLGEDSAADQDESAPGDATDNAAAEQSDK